ncbi:MAG TPA: hypothetical protein VF742_15690 [Terracidiphilus sp.]|jgi:hypothetical protein
MDSPEVLGLNLGLFTGIHVVLSLIAIVAGFLVLVLLIGRKQHTVWTPIFFVSSILTVLTGFVFPFKGITPAIILGVLSLIALIVAIVALLSKHLRGTYILSVSIALFFNVFVLIVQSFEKIGFLRAIAPTQSSPVFWITQLVGIAVIALLAWTAWRRYRAA